GGRRWLFRWRRWESCSTSRNTLRADSMADDRMRVMLTGGGTGGHVYPALAVASELRSLAPGVEFLYVGTRDGLESRIVPGSGLPFRSIRARGFLGKRPLEMGRAVVELVR